MRELTDIAKEQGTHQDTWRDFSRFGYDLYLGTLPQKAYVTLTTIAGAYIGYRIERAGIPAIAFGMMSGFIGAGVGAISGLWAKELLFTEDRDDPSVLYD